MRVKDLVDELSYCDEDALVFIEINGVVHDTHEILEDSQGVTLFIDPDKEEREMR